jgi:hypothetical protein
VNALADPKVAAFINEHCIATYLKVGTFQIIQNQKIGGNVASYFCLYDGGVLHAVPGPVDAKTLLNEARWAVETRKFALTRSTKLANGEVDMVKYAGHVRKAHEERLGNLPHHVLVHRANIPGTPEHQQAEAHRLLATDALAPIEQIYPRIWEGILHEKLSNLPVAQR